ncbi:MAG: polysaccharide pyruvyl transferase family protein [Myxococcota bacterium]
MTVTVAFDGAFAIDSAGDDAPLAYMVHALRKRLDRPRFVALVRHPDWRLARRLGVETAANLEHDSKTASLGRWYRGLNYGDSRSGLEAVAEVVASADLLVLGAGNFLTEVGIDVLRGHLPRFVAMTLAAQMAGTPVMLFGLSANRLRHPWTARAAQWLLHAADGVTFRERIAIENLEASGVRIPDHALLPDPALGAPPAAIGLESSLLAREGIPLRRGRRLGIALRDLGWLGRATAEHYEREQIALIDAWCANEGDDVLCVPQCTYDVDGPRTDDRRVAGTLRDHCRFPDKVHVIQGRYDYDEIESFYRAVDGVVATRLHGAVFAARMGIPVVGIAYEDKVRGFFDQLGMLEASLPWDASSTGMLERLHDLMADGDRTRTRLRAGIARLQAGLVTYVDLAERLATSSQGSRTGLTAGRRAPMRSMPTPTA